VDEQPFTVPDDLSSLAEPQTPSVAERAAARDVAVSMMRRALSELGLLVPAGQFPTYREAEVGEEREEFDVERGLLAGILIAVSERAALGTDVVDVMAGYEFAARDLDGAHTGASEDRWRRAILDRARLSSAIARLPYPSDVAAPNEICQAGDDVAKHAAQAASHAAAIRFLLQIPADVFAGGPLDTLTEIKGSISADDRELRRRHGAWTPDRTHTAWPVTHGVAKAAPGGTAMEPAR
jgi:hypothetical protein